MLSGADTVQAAKKAFKQGRYEVAIQLLEEFCSLSPARDSQAYVQAQVGLVKAYQQAGLLHKARDLTQILAEASEPEVRAWAGQKLTQLKQLAQEEQGVPEAITAADASASDSSPLADPAAGSPGDQHIVKAASLDSNSQPASPPVAVKVPLSSTAGPLLWVILGTVAVVVLLLFWTFTPDSIRIRLRFWPPRAVWREITLLGQWFVMVLGPTLNLSAAAYFLSTPLMDVLQKRVYEVRWISLLDLERRSPEAVRMLRQTCDQQDIKIPQLGVIRDPHPVAFSYGSSPNGARIVVSQGLLDRLDRAEIAAVYAHELGRICHRDIAVLTMVAAPLQLLYWLYIVVSQMGEGTGKRRNKDVVGHVAPLLYTLFIAGSFPLFFLCRIGTYHADHFATEATGDPNSLSRALLKISHGVLNEGRKLSRPSFLLDQVRLFSLFDVKTVTAASTAYQAASDPQQVRRIFLWDLFSPWARWMQINSSHPLLGKRIQILGQYAERLRLTPEFHMDQIQADRRQLQAPPSPRQFYLTMAQYAGEVVGLVGFWLVGLLIFLIWPQVGKPVIFGIAICGFGLGMAVKTWFLFPKGEASGSTVLEMMSDPDATPLSRQPVRLKGKMFGRGRVGYQLGAELKLQDETGTIPIRYTSRFGPVGNLFLSAKSLRPVIGAEVEVTGWLRRGLSPWLDISQIRRLDTGAVVQSHPRFWLILFGSVLVGVGLIVTFYFLPLFRLVRRLQRIFSWRGIRRLFPG